MEARADDIHAHLAGRGIVRARLLQRQRETHLHYPFSDPASSPRMK